MQNAPEPQRQMKVPFRQTELDRSMDETGAIGASTEAVSNAVLRLVGLELMIPEEVTSDMFQLKSLRIGGSDNLLNCFAPDWYAGRGLIGVFDYGSPPLLNQLILISPNTAFIEFDILQQLPARIGATLICRVLRMGDYP